MNLKRICHRIKLGQPENIVLFAGCLCHGAGIPPGVLRLGFLIRQSAHPKEVPMEIIISFFGLIIAIAAVILTVIQSRNAIRPSLKITKVQNNGGNTVIEIELSRMPFCYRIRSVSTLGWMPPKILDYGVGCYDPNTPQHSASASCRFWFVIAPSKQHIWLRIIFFSISFPWRSSYEIPAFNQDSTIV